MTLENREIYLPPVRYYDTLGMAWRPSYPSSFMSTSAFDVSISAGNINYYLKHTKELLYDLERAAQSCEALHDGTSFWYKDYKQAGSDYWFQLGRVVPKEHAPWGKIADSEDYLTVMQRDITQRDCPHTGHTVYITVAAHERILREERLNIRNIVVEQVQRGVSEGIAQAVADGTATLKQVQTEKQRLEEQLRQLNAAEQRIKAREELEAKREAQKAVRKANKTKAGFVYVVKQVGGDHYKIGRTADPDDRLRTFNVKLPFPVEFEILIKCDDMYKLESDLHYQYASKRVRGEWFALDTDDLEAIRGLQ